MTIELWKPIYLIEGYEEVNPSYLISNLGNLRGVQGRLLRPHLSIGYLRTNFKLGSSGKTKTAEIHRLVALAFVEGYKDKLVVNHINENKIDNRASNLEWLTIAQNSSYGSVKERIRAAVSTGKKKPVRATHVTTGEVLEFESVKEAALSGEFKRKGIWRATSGETPRYKNYKWEFI